MIICDMGRITPPPAPAIARNRISSMMFLENPAASDPIVYVHIAKHSACFRPNMSLSRP